MRRQEPKVLVAFWALSDYASFSQRLNRKSAKASASGRRSSIFEIPRNHLLLQPKAVIEKCSPISISLLADPDRRAKSPEMTDPRVGHFEIVGF
jgi:hypothetical protein